METRLDLVLELSREPQKIINYVNYKNVGLLERNNLLILLFHSRMPRSRVIVADITKAVEEWKPAGSLYLN